MGHLHKAAVGLGLVCVTGCEPEVELFPLTDNQSEEVAEAFRDTEQTLPVYDKLFKRMNVEATFDAQGGRGVDDLHVAFTSALDSGKALYQNGQFYAFDLSDPNLSERGDGALAFYRGSEIAEERYVAIARSSTDHNSLGFVDGGLIAHEMAHGIISDHTPEVYEALDESGYTSKEFLDQVVEKQDLCFLFSALGDTVRMFQLSAQLSVERFDETAASHLEGEYPQTPEEIYEMLSQDEIMLPQGEWAAKNYNDGKKWLPNLESIGLTPLDVIETFSKETSIYPEAHAAYMEKLAEFKREFIDAKENTEAALPEETDEEEMVDESDEGHAEDEEGSYGGEGRR